MPLPPDAAIPPQQIGQFGSAQVREAAAQGWQTRGRPQVVEQREHGIPLGHGRTLHRTTQQQRPRRLRELIVHPLP
jgi:hypothetical protein